MNTETHSASDHNIKVIQGCVALGTLYVGALRLTCPKQNSCFFACSLGLVES